MLSYHEVRSRCLKPNIAEKPLYARLLTYAISTRIVWLLSPYRAITPNQITFLSLAVGLAASYFALSPLSPGILIAALLLEGYFVLDCVDGQLSRLRQLQTKTGAFMDTVATYLVQGCFYLSLGHGLSAMTGKAYFLIAGTVAAGCVVWLSLIWHIRASIFLYHFLRSRHVSIKKKTTLSEPSREAGAPSIAAGIFSLLQKTLTFPLTMNLFTLLAIASYVIQQSTGDVSRGLWLMQVYLLYTAAASAIVAVLLTFKWILSQKIDRDYESLFSVE